MTGVMHIKRHDLGTEVECGIVAPLLVVVETLEIPEEVGLHMVVVVDLCLPQQPKLPTQLIGVSLSVL